MRRPIIILAALGTTLSAAAISTNPANRTPAASIKLVALWIPALVSVLALGASAIVAARNRPRTAV